MSDDKLRDYARRYLTSPPTEGNVTMTIDEMRLEALRLANSQHEPADIVVKRAEAYTAFLAGVPDAATREKIAAYEGDAYVK